MKKSQAALEFLMTYGWAFLIIFVVIGGFVYLGVLRPDQYVAERCITSSGFNCAEHSLTGTGPDYVIATTIENYVGSKITIISEPTITSDICPGDVCTIDSTQPDLSSGYAIGAGDSKTINITIIVPNGIPRGQKFGFDFNFEYTQERKDFEKTFQMEVFAELN